MPSRDRPALICRVQLQSSCGTSASVSSTLIKKEGIWSGPLLMGSSNAGIRRWSEGQNVPFCQWARTSCVREPKASSSWFSDLFRREWRSNKVRSKRPRSVSSSGFASRRVKVTCPVIICPPTRHSILCGAVVNPAADSLPRSLCAEGVIEPPSTNLRSGKIAPLTSRMSRRGTAMRGRRRFSHPAVR